MSGLSIIIPALNEDQKISLTVKELLQGGRQYLTQFELILVDDGSTDQTGEVMDRLTQGNPEVKVIHHPQRSGVGQAYRSGMNMAQYEYITMIPGDHELNKKTFEDLFQAVGKKDLVIGYRVNQSVARPIYRVVISRLYTKLMNLLFRFQLKDFDSLIVYPAKLLKGSNSQSSGYTYQMELLVYMLRKGLTYTEVPILLNPVEVKSSRSLNWRTFWDVASMACSLLMRR